MSQSQPEDFLLGTCPRSCVEAAEPARGFSSRDTSEPSRRRRASPRAFFFRDRGLSRLSLSQSQPEGFLLGTRSCPRSDRRSQSQPEGFLPRDPTSRPFNRELSTRNTAATEPSRYGRARPGAFYSGRSTSESTELARGLFTRDRRAIALSSSPSQPEGFLLGT